MPDITVETREPTENFAIIAADNDLSHHLEHKTNYEKRLQDNPENIEALNGLAAVRFIEGWYSKSETLYRHSLQCNPEQPRIYYRLGKLYQKTFRFDEAIFCFNRSLQMEREFIPAYIELGIALYQRGQSEQATKVFKLAHKLHPKSNEPIYWQARVAMTSGDMEGAIQVCRDYLKIYQGEPNLFWMLVESGEATLDEPFVKQILQLVEQENKPLTAKHSWCYSLGMLYHKHKAYDEAFKWFERGAALRMEDEKKDVATIMKDTNDVFFNIEETLTKEPVSKWKSPLSDEELLHTPIFIVGMPRSGTSLVEQILASHSKVEGAGEQNYMRYIGHLELATALRHEYPEALIANHPANTDDLWKKLANYYQSTIRRHIPEALSPDFISDKNPHNFVYIGLIRRLFPQAKIIHCTRDPMDTCLSIYSYNFHGVHNYSYNLETLGHHYGRYAKLMQHWHHLFPGWIYDINYETLTANPEEEIRKLADFCGLKWENQMLDFHQTKRSTKTLSATQVAKPIYRTSIKRWHAYAHHLGPLVKSLKTHGNIVVEMPK